jgi:hypothetical protein
VLGRGRGREFGAEHLLERRSGHSQDIAEVHNLQAGPAAGGAPLLGQGVRLGPADPQQHGGFFDGQERRDTLIHRHNSQTLTAKL